MSTTLPQAASQAVSSQIPQARNNDVQQDVSQRGTANQPAATVSLSSNSKARSVSSGSNKFVDSSFESDSSNQKAKNHSPESTKGSIFVTA